MNVSLKIGNVSAWKEYRYGAGYGIWDLGGVIDLA